MDKLLDKLTIDEKAKIKKVHLDNGQILFHEGDKCECVGILISGEIEIVSYSFEGKEIIFNHLYEGMIFGNNLIFSSTPLYKGSIIAKKVSEIALIYKNELIQLLQSNKDFLLQYLQYQSDMGKDLNSKIKLLSIDSAEERLFYYAYINNNIIKYSSITKLAATLSLQRETLSRLISRLVKENRVKKEKHILRF